MNPGRRFKRYLLTGFLVLAPLSISVFLLLWLVAMVDGLLSPVSNALVGRELPGLGLVTALSLALAAGWLASNIAGQQILEAIEDLVRHVPVLNWLYGTVKQLTEVFSPGAKSQFKSVVMVEYPREGVYQLGFATGSVEREEAGRSETLTSVYIPTNHLYIGDLVLVPPARIKTTSMTLQEGIQFFLSLGASTPPALRTDAFEQKGPDA
ncbi:MAG: DUF502 domain-containing protein [Elusimicrobia bacterium]|nr:DUF502 domain-containing protein [Elusimicrobiota bacterium]